MNSRKNRTSPGNAVRVAARVVVSMASMIALLSCTAAARAQGRVRLSGLFI